MVFCLFIKKNIFQACILKTEKEKFHKKIKVNNIQNSKIPQELQKNEKMKIIFYLQVVLVIPTHTDIYNLNSHYPVQLQNQNNKLLVTNSNSHVLLINWLLQ